MEAYELATDRGDPLPTALAVALEALRRAAGAGTLVIVPAGVKA